MIELAFPIATLKDCRYGDGWFAIAITTVRKGERTYPAKCLDGVDAANCEEEAVGEG